MDIYVRRKYRLKLLFTTPKSYHCVGKLASLSYMYSGDLWELEEADGGEGVEANGGGADDATDGDGAEAVA